MSQSFGNLIRQARIDKGYNQRELAQLLGTSYTYLSKLENDRAGTPPSKKTIDKLATHLELNAEALRYLAGRITEEEARIFENFVKHNYKIMATLFYKMRDDPDFVQEVIKSDVNYPE
ncbi:MAG: helix-turn-helix domain-containing protein [Cyanobacteria bacterium]|jgi:transcriptional regulator with XRE-family HTH domain|nr:helix-turn-helix domain-containing protein [Cyanobacteria bacterium GSL.Bin1]